MSLTLTEARARAAALADVSYDLELDLTNPDSGRYGVRAVVGFAATTSETFLELTAATDLEVEVNGEPTEPSYDGRRLLLTGLAARNEVVVSARLPYVTDGDGMHLVTDPADGETYASAYLGMDVAQRVFPCFDQNDLKAPVTLSVVADPAWTVLANGRLAERDGGRWRFERTQPIPLAMFVVCAGPWHSVTWEHAGLPFGWHARRSLAAELDRDAAELRAVTEACFDHYAELFSEPFAFGSYDQAFVPGQNWGALESPGCVTYRDELLPRGRATGLLRTRRNAIIAHEMAHMWFGNLVTMTWWEDTWLQESFADYMGFRVSGDAVGDPAALLSFEVGRKPAAYDADLRRSTHPVAPLATDVPDVDAAANNFDAISYAKGNSSLRQLVTWLGDETFLAGLDTYLTRHRLGNATLDDFLSALDEASDRDVRAWADLWLRETGHDTLRVTRDGDGTPVLTRTGRRPHRVRVTAYDVAGGAPEGGLVEGGLVEVGSRMVDVADEPVRLDGWPGLVVVPNSHGETFAALAFDDLSWGALRDGLASVTDDLVRAVVWTHVFGALRSRALPAEAVLDLVAAHLPAERQPSVVAAVLTRVLGVLVPQRLPADRAAYALDVVAEACRAGLATTDPVADEQVRVELARGLAAASRDHEALRAWLADDRTDAGVELDPALRWSVVHRLAELGALDASAIEQERLRDGTVEGELGAARALAARPTPEAKAQAWAAISGDERLSNRMLGAISAGLWSVEHADLVAPCVTAYLTEAPRLARRGQAFAQEVHRAFPALALTEEQVALLEHALAGDLPTVLRRGWEDRLDDLR